MQNVAPIKKQKMEIFPRNGAAGRRQDPETRRNEKDGLYFCRRISADLLMAEKLKTEMAFNRRALR